MKPLNLFTQRWFKSSFHLTTKYISFVFISIVVLFIALPAFAQKGEKAGNNVLEERIEGLKNEVVLRNEKTEQRIDALKEEVVLRDDKIEQTISIYLAVLGLIFVIGGFLGYKTIVKWIQQRIEDKTGKEVKKYIQEKGKPAIEELLGKFKEELNKIESTRMEYEKRLDRLPKDIDISKPMPKDTREDLRKFVEKLPEAKTEKTYSHTDWFYKGVGEYEREEYLDAIHSLTKAIELDPQNASYYNIRGVAYVKCEEYEKAIEDYDKAIELSPKGAGWYSNRGVAYLKLEDYKKAVEDYNKAIELDPKKIIAYLNLSEVFIIVGSFKDALDSITKALDLPIELEPSHKAICFYLECIAKKLLKLNTSESEEKFNGALQKEFALIWDAEPIESWLKKADISDDDKDYILRLTQLLKTKKT